MGKHWADLRPPVVSLIIPGLTLVNLFSLKARTHQVSELLLILTKRNWAQQRWLLRIAGSNRNIPFLV